MPSALRRSGFRRRGVSNLIATILMVALTVVAIAIIYAINFRVPSGSPSISYLVRSGISYPVYGDPTDCVPWGFPLNQSGTTAWQNAWTQECSKTETGEYSLMNASMIVFTAHTPSSIALSLINLTFICNGTTLVTGSLAAMSWFPGSTTTAPANAPHLGVCGTFNPQGSGKFSTLYNRLGVFIPISNSSADVLVDGDVWIQYIHTPGSVFDPGVKACGSPGPDCDDYHGAPPWCFTVIGACTIYLTYSGAPQTLLAKIPVYTVGGQGA